MSEINFLEDLKTQVSKRLEFVKANQSPLIFYKTRTGYISRHGDYYIKDCIQHYEIHWHPSCCRPVWLGTVPMLSLAKAICDQHWEEANA